MEAFCENSFDSHVDLCISIVPKVKHQLGTPSGFLLPVEHSVVLASLKPAGTPTPWGI